MTDYYGPENEEWRSRIAAFNQQHGQWRGTATKSTLPAGWENMSPEAFYAAINRRWEGVLTESQLSAIIKRAAAQLDKRKK